MARKELAQRGFDEDEITGGGLKVTTTFNYGQQKKMHAAAQNELPKKNDDLHVGMATVQPGTGQLLAMYGGPDYLKSQLNWATTRRGRVRRSSRSRWPRRLRTASRSGDIFQGDSPITVQGQKFGNELNTDYGDVTLMKATEQSINTAFYDLVDNADGQRPVEGRRRGRGGRHPEDQDAGERTGTTRPPCSVRMRTPRRSTWRTPTRPSPPSGKYTPLHTIKEVPRPGRQGAVVGREHA